MDATEADARMRGRAGSWAGASLAISADHTGDGLADIWVGAPRWGGGKGGRVWLLPSIELLGEGQLEPRAVVSFRGASGSSGFGTSLAVADFDADGQEDVVIGAPTTLVGGDRPGGAWTLFGPFAGETVVSLSSGAHLGVDPKGRAGHAVATGDFNGDGFADVVVSAPGSRANDTRLAGTVSVFFGGEDVVDEVDWFTDVDGDGWGGGAIAACAQPPGTVARGGDCDDADDAIHPFAPETDCADATDYNCDGVAGAVDLDGDGFDACSGDCDDADDAIHPAAAELCGDGLDNDCDLAIDDGSAVDAPTWYPDNDRDGFGLNGFGIAACERPDIFLGGVAMVDGDCNDLNDDISPAAVEYCDLQDNDCDGAADESDALDALRWQADTDLDGFGSALEQVRACSQPAGYVRDATDCDDADDAVHPAALERCNFVDDDCAGAAYLGGTLEPVPFVSAEGAGEGDRFGQVVVVVPDVTGDGLDDLAVGAPSFDGFEQNGGAVYLLPGTAHPDAIDLATAQADGSGWYGARIAAPWRAAELGTAIVGGDFNGDGVSDFAASAPGFTLDGADRGAIFFWYGPQAGGEMSPETADAVLLGASAGDRAGTSLDRADLDGDGFDDLVVGAPRAGGDAGAAYVVYSAADWDTTTYLTDADATF
jgi:hypothetical protein